MTRRSKPSFTEAVFDFLTARPGQWVSADVLAVVGGKYAWRTRTSEARVQLETAGLGTIRNRLSRKNKDDVNTPYTVSEYKFEPYVAQAPDQAGWLF